MLAAKQLMVVIDFYSIFFSILWKSVAPKQLEIEWMMPELSFFGWTIPLSQKSIILLSLTLSVKVACESAVFVLLKSDVLLF